MTEGAADGEKKPQLERALGLEAMDSVTETTAAGSRIMLTVNLSGRLAE